MIKIATISKGAQTREAIVLAGYDLARRVGLDGLTIGSIATAVRMSKSGLFAHFGSREDLQLAVLAHAIEEVSSAAFRPAFKRKRGLTRLRAVIQGWLDFVSALDNGGCLILAAVSEFDDKPGPLRDQLVLYQRQLREQMERTVQMSVESGELRAETDPAQVAFELYGTFLVLHHDQRLFNDLGSTARTRVAADAIVARHLS